ncbi:oligopeptidase B, partial [Klebsiella pneumoniae]
KSSFALGAYSISNDHSKLAFSFDEKGAEQYKIKVKSLNNFTELEDEVNGTLGEIVWNSDGSGFYYSKLNDNWRSDKVFFHYLGTQQQDDILIYQEL